MSSGIMSSRVMKLASVYEGWTVLRVATIELADGQSIHREVEDHGLAVAVLPYDPQRRVALLVRLMRAPMLIATGEDSSLEAPAGINEDVDAPACARREVLEECGLRIGVLEPVVNAWTMPGLSTERIELFLARYGPGDRVAPGGGLPEEHENIEPVEMPLGELLALADAGQLADLKTFALVMALYRRNPELFSP